MIPTIVAVVLLGGGAGAWAWTAHRAPTKPLDPADRIIAKTGIHWHPQLDIYIKGEHQTIPTDIGLKPTEQPIHTHDDTGKIHLEFPGHVLAKDIRLSEFFRIWKKTFTATCVFDKCNGPEGTVKMTVNGNPNTDFGDYEMRDEDRIEIRYE